MAVELSNKCATGCKNGAEKAAKIIINCLEQKDLGKAI